jgi:integrase
MASSTYDAKTGKARVFFRIGARQYNKTVKVKSARAATALCETIDQTIADLERGRLTLPPGSNLVAFIVSGGAVVQSTSGGAAAKGTLRLADVFERYRSDSPPHLEASTRLMQEIHFRRVLEVFPSKTVGSFDKAAAQEYVSRRSKQRYRGKPIQRETIAKELKTLRQAWSWVAMRSTDLSPPTFTLKELSFPKSREKLPFMSWTQIEREIARGGLSDDEIKDLWDCLWLDRQEVRGLLDYVRQAGGPAYLYPMVCCAAYTGARRSELCRSRIADWRFDDKTVKVRQKKRDKEKTFSYRDVPIHPTLAEVSREWFSRHPGGQLAFCRDDRETVTWDTATWHLKEALKGSRWSVVRGWHVLRHSFASNLAAANKDQRKIDRWMGHSTEIRWRYQHLRPEDQQDDIGVL